MTRLLIFNKSNIFESITTLHGVDKLSQKKHSSYKVWRLAMLVNLLITLTYLIVIRNRYHDDHIITRINANCKINQVPFPAVSICNNNLVSYKKSQIIQNILKSSNVTQSEIEVFLQSLPNLMDYLNSNGRIVDFKDILDILKRHYFTLETIMEEVHQNCEDLLLYCTFNRKLKNCNEIFSLIKTYEGHCCAFNYVALNDNTDDSSRLRFIMRPAYTGLSPDEDDDMEHYDDVSDNKHPNIIVTSESGRGSGLRVVFNVEPSDYPSWSLTPFYGAQVIINDPNDYPEVTVQYKQVGVGVSLDIKVQPFVFQSNDDIRRIGRAKRGCVFHDEVDLEHTDRYSRETCATECRMKSFRKHCGCLPYKYPQEPATRICEFKDLECLNNFRAKGSSEERYEPVCYLECRDKKYSITSDVMPLVAGQDPPDVTSGRNLSELSALQVYFDKPTCNCYKQMLLMDFTSFIATYGGIFSLSFGASLLTLFEIVYLLIALVTRYLWKSFQDVCT